ncbi:MAG: T9SS type A sorting domain-containing protein [Flavipsychrobacter sp.]|nr:T9SS type A sorting domain-containing protein [Flavipsychrobacter sp.]
MKYILVVTVLLFGSAASFAQPVIRGTVRDVDSQLVFRQLVEIYTDSQGLQYPYYDTTHTDIYGKYSFTMPTNLPIGIIFKVRTFNCGNPATNLQLYPYNNANCNFNNVCATARYIRGDVYKGGNFADKAQVNLIRKRQDTVTSGYVYEVADSTLVDSMGYYVFKIPLQSADSYLVKAGLLPADTADYLKYMPSYHSTDLSWNLADVVPNANAEADVVLPMVFAMAGQGYVTGVVNDTVGNTLYKRILILTTANDVPVGYCYSDIDGTFSFGGLNYDSYKLYGDALGKYNPPLQFFLSGNNQAFTDITFVESTEAFIGSLWPLKVSNTLQQQVTLYPNPATDYLHIQGLEAVAGVKEVVVMNVSGSVVYRKNYSGNADMLVPVGDLTSGLYLVQINTESGRYQYKIAH